ncbi:MAG: DUF3313 family protein [Halioglobus sp.]
MLNLTNTRISSFIGPAALCGVLALVGACASTEKSEMPEVSDDGLTLVEGTEVGAAYLQPGADFSQYKRLAIMDVNVSFRKDWMRDQNRDSAALSGRITQKDADRVKQHVAEEFQKVFTEELVKGGYAVVDYEGVDNSAQDLIVLRPAIVNLDVTAPDTMSAGMSRTYTTSTGSMTLVLEFFDSVTSSLLGRVMDTEAVRDAGYMSISNSVTNKSDADRMMRKWARLLVEKLDEVHGK